MNLLINRTGEDIAQVGLSGCLQELSLEVMGICKTAEDMVAQLVCRSIAESRKPVMSPAQMESAMQELQLARSKLKRENRARVHHSLVRRADYDALKASGKTKDAVIKSMIEQARDAFDPEAIRIDPKTDCVGKIESRLLMDAETNFWSAFELQFKG